MTFVKNVCKTIVFELITIFAFGGGLLLIGLPLLFIFEPPKGIAILIFLITFAVPVPICWWLAEKFGDKIL